MRHKLPLLSLLGAPLLGATLASSGLAGEGRAASDLDAPDLAVRNVISSYGRAVETQDVELFRALMPGIPTGAKRRLRESFRTVKSQRVDMTVDFIDVGGKTATVCTSRVDTIEGRRMKPVQQVFHLVLRDDGWRIHSLSASR